MPEGKLIKSVKYRRQFLFQSKFISKFFNPEDRRSIPSWCPSYIQELLFELYEQTRGLNYFDATEPGGFPSISMFDRTQIEICVLVDWVVCIWNQIVAKDIRSRKFTVDELIQDVETRDGWSSRHHLLLLFDSWEEGDEEWDASYVSPQKYAFDGVANPIATPGNLCASFGLAMLDRAMLLEPADAGEEFLDAFSAAWHFALVARSLNRGDIGYQFEVKANSAKMAKAAAKRYERDPKQAAKALVRECWTKWQEQPQSYSSIVGFARDMIDKWPNELTSEAVVSRWVREWRRKSESE